MTLRRKLRPGWAIKAAALEVSVGEADPEDPVVDLGGRAEEQSSFHEAGEAAVDQRPAREGRKELTLSGAHSA